MCGLFYISERPSGLKHDHILLEFANKNVWCDINQRPGYPYLPHIFWSKTWEIRLLLGFCSLDSHLSDLYSFSDCDLPIWYFWLSLGLFLNIMVILKSELFCFALHRLQRLVAHWQSIGNQICWRQKTSFYILVSYVEKSSNLNVCYFSFWTFNA